MQGWNECAYCHNQIPQGDGIYLDESGVDGTFCNDVCAEAFVCSTIKTVAEELPREQEGHSSQD